jgi:hypothetical protein
MNLYPQLVRNQRHDYHDYTLQLSDSGVDVRLTEQQVLSLHDQIEQDQKPIGDEDAAVLRAAFAAIRINRGLT